MSACQVRHTVFQPMDTDEQWRCPRCDATAQMDFVVESSPDEVDVACPLLHDEDEVRCGECGYAASGKAVAKAMMKKYNRVKCPTCKGCGTVPA